MERLCGIIAINKPKGITSFDVIYKLRKITGIKRIGHAGTLDPLASGVLIVAIGRENTKKISDFVKQEKEYIAEIKLGFNSTTYDEEGEKEEVEVENIPSLPEIKKVISENFVGKIEQIPPLYSAIKINGKSAYKYARTSTKLETQSSKLSKLMENKKRKVIIKKIEILKYQYPILKIQVTCGSGTYIRSLAYDLGKKLKTGGYVKELQRTKVGDFRLEDCLELDALVCLER